MRGSFLKWFLCGALLVGGLHARETFQLMLESASVESVDLLVVTPIEAAAERRS